jgi:uncharacterized membrane protein (UPF0127 family)
VHEKLTAVNKTRGVSLASEVEVAKSLFRRLKGLIGRRAPDFPPGCGMWIIPCNGIHTFAMKIPIDAAYLDSSHRVLRLCREVPPFRIAPLSFRTRSVLELPAGTLARSNSKVGDIIEFQKVEKTNAGDRPTQGQAS